MATAMVEVRRNESFSGASSLVETESLPGAVMTPSPTQAIGCAPYRSCPRDTGNRGVDSKVKGRSDAHEYKVKNKVAAPVFRGARRRMIAVKPKSGTTLCRQ